MAADVGLQYSSAYKSFVSWAVVHLMALHSVKRITGVEIEEEGETQQVQGLAVIHVQESEDYGKEGDGRDEEYLPF